MDLSRWMTVSSLVVDSLLFSELWMANNGTSRWAYHAISKEQCLRSKIWPIEIQENTALCMYCNFQHQVFSSCAENERKNNTQTRTHDDYHMPPGLRPPRHKNLHQTQNPAAHYNIIIVRHLWPIKLLHLRVISISYHMPTRWIYRIHEVMCWYTQGRSPRVY